MDTLSHSHDRPWTIGELAAETGLTFRALRFYEQRGLLKPLRRGTKRLYTPACRERARRIVEFTGYGLTLTEAGAMLDMTERETIPLLAAHLVDIQHEADRLRASEESLRCTLHNLEARWAA